MSEKNPNPIPQEEQGVEQASLMTRFRKPFAIAAGALVLVGGGYALGERGENNDNHAAHAADTLDESAVEGVNASAADLARNKFLPAEKDGKIESEKEARDYLTEYLVGNDGVLDDDGNAASLSALNSVVGAPASSKSVDLAKNIPTEFRETLEDLGDAKFAEETSDINTAIVNQDWRFDAQTLSRGEQYTELVPVYKGDEIVGAKLVSKVSKVNEPGVTVKQRGEGEYAGIDEALTGYHTIGILGDGSIVLPGVKVEPKPSKEKGPEKAPNGKQVGEEDSPAGNKPSNKPTPSGNKPTKNPNAGGTNQKPSNESNGPGNGVGGGSNETSGNCGGCGQGTGGGNNNGNTGCASCGTGGTPTPNPNPTPTPTCEDTGTCPTPTPNPGKPVDPGLRP